MIKLKRIFSLLPAVMLAALLGSCADDRLPADDIAEYKDPNLKQGSLTVAFAISADRQPLGRGALKDVNDANDGDYVDGIFSEHHIGPGGNFAIFFRSDNSFHSYSFLTLPEDIPDERPNVEIHYRAKITGIHEELPLNCMVIINASLSLSETIMNLTAADNITTAINKMVEANGNPAQIGVNRNGNDVFFTMSTSAYIEGGAVRRTVPVTSVNVQDDDIGFDEKKVVHIQVERMLAKFTFKISPKEKVVYDPAGRIFTYENNEIVYCSGFLADGTPQYVPRHWKAQITGWDVNAVEKKEHVLKNINPAGNYFSDWVWNVPADWRTYWAEDFNYTQSDYPWQYHKAYNNKKVASKTGNYPHVPYYLEKGDNNYLLNYSYTKLDNHDFDRSVFVPENTYDAARVGDLDSRTPLLAGSHLLVTARLLTDVKTENTYEATDVYRDINGIFYTDPRDAFWAQVYAFNLSLKSQIQMRFHAYNWDGNENRTITVGNQVKTIEVGDTLTAYTKDGNYSLYLYDKPVTRDLVQGLSTDFFKPAQTKDGDGKLLPWIDGLNIRNADGTQLKIYHYIDERIDITSGDATKPNTNDRMYLGYATENDFKSIWLEWAAEMEHYTDGRMYYAAPAFIRKAEDESQKDIYGVVRNNWYSYTLTEVRKLGYPVDKPDDPIVPNTTALYDRLNITLDIIDWHKLTTEGAIFP